jgi:molybdenum cofactor cytidylyltransferase
VSKIAAIILAAGGSTRFAGGAGPTKVVAELAGTPLVRHVADAALGSRARPVIVVTGHAAAQTATVLKGCDVEIIHAANHAAGLSRSLRAGLMAVPATADGALVLLADMPLVTSTLIDRLIDTFDTSPDAAAIVPTHDGRRGNPVLIARKLFMGVAALEGDRGASQILAKAEGVVECPVADRSILADVDTLDDLHRLRPAQEIET